MEKQNGNGSETETETKTDHFGTYVLGMGAQENNNYYTKYGSPGIWSVAK